MKKSFASLIFLAAAVVLPRPKGKHELLNPDIPVNR
jgi:hypothetical protein